MTNTTPHPSEVEKAQPSDEPELCFCDRMYPDSNPDASCGDCPTRDYGRQEKTEPSDEEIDAVFEDIVGPARAGLAMQLFARAILSRFGAQPDQQDREGMLQRAYREAGLPGAQPAASEEPVSDETLLFGMRRLEPHLKDVDAAVPELIATARTLLSHPMYNPVAAQAHPNVVDKGPWKAGKNKGDGRRFLESDDFTHDVRLYIDGDFASDEDKAVYADGIARQLNSAQAGGPTTTCNGMPAYEGPLSAAQASGQAQQDSEEAKARLWREWGIDGMPRDKIKLAEAAFAAGLAAQASEQVPDAYNRKLTQQLDNEWAVLRNLQNACAQASGQADPWTLFKALHRIAAWPDGGEHYGQEKIKRFAQDTIDAALQRASGPAQDAVEAAMAAVLAESGAGVYYMDPPDGGSITASEQVRRMAEDAARYRAWRDAMITDCPGFLEGMAKSLPDDVGRDRRPTAKEWDAAIDAARPAGGEQP